jgi:hypothetical protein
MVELLCKLWWKPDGKQHVPREGMTESVEKLGIVEEGSGKWCACKVSPLDVFLCAPRHLERVVAPKGPVDFRMNPSFHPAPEPSPP